MPLDQAICRKLRIDVIHEPCWNSAYVSHETTNDALSKKCRAPLPSWAGTRLLLELRAGSQRLRAELVNSQVGATGFIVGQEAWAHLPPAARIALDD